MGIESTSRLRLSAGSARLCSRSSDFGRQEAAESGFLAGWDRFDDGRGRVHKCIGTPGTCVLAHAMPLSVTAVYEVSGENFPPTDLQEICCAVSFSISAIGPPQ
jgi:hypothetical protein